MRRLDEDEEAALEVWRERRPGKLERRSNGDAERNRQRNLTHPPPAWMREALDRRPDRSRT